MLRIEGLYGGYLTRLKENVSVFFPVGVSDLPIPVVELLEVVEGEPGSAEVIGSYIVTTTRSHAMIALGTASITLSKEALIRYLRQ